MKTTRVTNLMEGMSDEVKAKAGADGQIMLEKMETDKESILLFYDTIEEANEEALSWT